MENWQILYRLAAQRQCEDISAALKAQMLQEAQNQSRPRIPRIHWHDRLLNRLGILMETWGCRLQTRYARLALHPGPCQPAGSEGMM